MTERIAIALPWSPTVNTYWRAVNIPKVGVRVLISKEGREYRKTALQWIERQRIPVGVLTGKLAVSITAFPPDRRARDLDNLLKSLLDAIKEAKIIRDDADIDDLRITRGPIRPRGAVHVYISEIAGEATVSRELFDEFAEEPA